MNISSENVEGEIGGNVWVFPMRSLIYYSKTTFVVNSIACMHRASLSSYVYREITDVYVCVKMQQEILLNYCTYFSANDSAIEKYFKE